MGWLAASYNPPPSYSPSNEAALGYEITAQTPQFCVSFFAVLLSWCLGQPRGSHHLEWFILNSPVRQTLPLALLRDGSHFCWRFLSFSLNLMSSVATMQSIGWALTDLHFICLGTAGTGSVKSVIAASSPAMLVSDGAFWWWCLLLLVGFDELHVGGFLLTPKHICQHASSFWACVTQIKVLLFFFSVGLFSVLFSSFHTMVYF